MKHNILITGGSGYLGGTLLANWQTANLSDLYDNVFALVRTHEQEEAIKQYNVLPINVNVDDEAAVINALISNNISVVGYMIGVLQLGSQVSFIKGLREVKDRTGRDVHFIYTNGTKMYAEFAGAPADRPFVDSALDTYDIHKAQKSKHEIMQQVIDTDIAFIDLGEQYDVRVYTFCPCIVYGQGEGFGKTISIQTVDVVMAALAAGKVFSLDPKAQTWPVCHIKDTTGLYLHLLRQILEDKSPDHGKHGFYLASPGLVPWSDIHGAIATALAKRGKIATNEVKLASQKDLAAASKAKKVPAEELEIWIAGHCTFTPRHGREIGWVPEFSPEHILEAMDAEVQHILQTKEL